MQGMFDGIKGELRGGKKVLSRTVACSLPEGILAKGLGEIQHRYDDIEIGSYPIMRRGVFGVNLVLRGRDEIRLAAATEEVAAMVRALGDTPIEE